MFGLGFVSSLCILPLFLKYFEFCLGDTVSELAASTNSILEQREFSYLANVRFWIFLYLFPTILPWISIIIRSSVKDSSLPRNWLLNLWLAKSFIPIFFCFSLFSFYILRLRSSHASLMQLTNSQLAPLDLHERREAPAIRSTDQFCLFSLGLPDWERICGSPGRLRALPVPTTAGLCPCGRGELHLRQQVLLSLNHAFGPCSWAVPNLFASWEWFEKQLCPWSFRILFSVDYFDT